MSEKRFDKIDTQLEKIDSRLDVFEKILDRNTRIVDEHERRSTVLERQLVSELKPIKTHVAMVEYGFRAIVGVAIGIAGIAGFIKILHELGIFN